ncbi:hypothetical protein KXW78_008507, partial [Aspergillus fumigatus]
ENKRPAKDYLYKYRPHKATYSVLHSTRDDGLLAQVALAQLLVEFQQAQTARPLGVKDRRVKQVELSLGYRMLQYRWNTSKD